MPLLVEGIPPRYRVERFIAEGGMGCVFEGFDRNLDQRVALKVLRRDLASLVTAERFKREGRVLARLKHPNIVSVFDSLETSNGLLVLVMEYVDGPTLQEVLKTRRLSIDEARGFGLQLLGALQHAHDQGIIHRDIKPGNIFIRGSDALLGDFGIAYSEDPDTTTLTAEGTHPGTLLYMAPEQLVGAASPRSDIFSLGLVLRQCFTGVGEADVRSPGKDAWKGIRLDVKRAVERAVADDPANRWQTAARFHAALKATARTLGGRLSPVFAAAALLALGASVVSPPGIRFLCRMTGWSMVCGQPSARPLYDLAILPLTGESGRDDGVRISRLIGEDIAPFPVVRLWDPARAAIWWDSLPQDRKEVQPPATRYYTSGSVKQASGRFEVDLVIHDSTGRRYARVSASEDTARMQLLARSVAEQVVCKAFMPDCEEFRGLTFRETDDQAIAEFFRGKDSVAKGNWAAGERHFREALSRDRGFMVAAWELMIAKRLQRKDFSEDLQYIARNIDSLPPFYRGLATASLTPDLRERFHLFEASVRDSRRNGTALLLYTNELFHRGALVGRPLEATVDTMTVLAATEPAMNHSSTYDMAWWGELRLGREERAWRDLAQRKALGPPPGDTYSPFQRLGTYARFSPWKADAARFLLLRSPSESDLKSLTNFARLGSLMDIPEEQLALGEILGSKGTLVPQRAAGVIGLAGAHLMLGRPAAALAMLDSAAGMLASSEMELQQREWPVHLAALGLYFDTTRVDSARAWLEGASLEGNERVRALYALGRDAVVRNDMARAEGLEAQLRTIGSASPSALRHAELLGAELAAARGDPAGALQASEVIYFRDTTLVRLSPFARATTYLNRGKWQKALNRPDAADAEWLWYESSDFEGWPSHEPQEGEIDAILSVYARLLRGELDADRGNMTLACQHLGRVKELWARAEPGMKPLLERAKRAREKARCT